jgi:hypothetical protein
LKNLHSKKLEKLEEIDIFLNSYNHPKLNQVDTNHLNISITHNEIEEAIKSLPKKKSSTPGGFSTEFYQTFTEELIPTLLKLFHKIEKEGTLPKSIYSQYYTHLRTRQGHNKKKRISDHSL